jgi:two-component system, LuxR family, response regulator FixJ
VTGKQVVYVVDDDPGVRATLTAVLEGAGHLVRDFESGNVFLKEPLASEPGCILLDVYLPDISGMAILRALRERGNRMPIVMMTGRADISIAVQAMKNGAVDFIEKPFQPESIIDMVSILLKRSREAAARPGAAPDLGERVASLTQRERAVVRAVLIGASSKDIARDLAISPRTVEVHRRNLLRKLGVRSTPDLLRRLPLEELDRLLSG